MTYLEMGKEDKQAVRAEMIAQAQKMMRDAGYKRATIRFGARRMVDQALAAERKRYGNTEDSNAQQLTH